MPYIPCVQDACLTQGRVGAPSQSAAGHQHSTTKRRLRRVPPLTPPAGSEDAAVGTAAAVATDNIGRIRQPSTMGPGDAIEERLTRGLSATVGSTGTGRNCPARARSTGVRLPGHRPSGPPTTRPTRRPTTPSTGDDDNDDDDGDKYYRDETTGHCGSAKLLR